MRANFKSALIACLIATVIWMMITAAVGMNKAAVDGGGALFLVGATLITVAIARVISNRAGNARAR